MSDSQFNSNKTSSFHLSPVVVIRICAIFYVGLMIGHMSGYPWSSTLVPEETALVTSMKTVDFIFAGERQSYWGLYLGWGILVAVLLLTIAIILWLVSDLARVAPKRVGAITAVMSVVSLIGSFISFRFFYVPPTVFFAVLCVGLLGATVQLITGRGQGATSDLLTEF